MHRGDGEAMPFILIVQERERVMMTKMVPWKDKSNKQKAAFIASIALTLAAAVTVSALGNYFFHLWTYVDNDRGVSIAGSWIGNDIEGQEVVPGSTFQLSQEITNKSTEPVYVFVRIDTEENAYKISQLHPDWTVVKEADNMILLAFGSTRAMNVVSPEVVLEFEGILTLDVTNTEFVELEDSALDYSIHACGVAVSKCEGRIAPLDVYEVYETVGGN